MGRGGNQPPAGYSSLMPSAGAAATGVYSDDVYFSPDDTYYLGYDSVNAVNGRPREIRFTRKLVSDYAAAIAESPAEINGIILKNSTAAVSGTQQYSPSIFLGGQGWETGGGSSDPVVYRFETRPVEGASVSGNLQFAVSLNGGAYSNIMHLASGGSLYMDHATAGHILWVTDGGGSVGAAAASRPDYVYAVSGFNVGNGGTVLSSADLSSGLGTTTNLTSSTDQELLISNTGRTMGSGNVSVAIGADLNSGSPTSDHVVLDVGYTDNGDAWQSLWQFEAGGGLQSSDTSTATVTGDIADGAAAIVHKLDSSNTMSTAGAKLLSVQNNSTEKFYVDKDGDVVSDTEVGAGNLIWAGASGSRIGFDASTGGTGLTGREIYTENVAHTLQLRSVYSSGSGNISIALDADVNAASIDDAHKIASFGWLNNSDTRTDVFSILGNGGSVTLAAQEVAVTASASANPALALGTGSISGVTAGLQTKVQVETLSPAAVETSMSTTIPAGSVIRAVIANCESALTGGGTTVTWSVGTAADPDKYGTAGYPTQADSLAQNSKSNWTGAVQTGTSAETIVLTGAATGGAADGDTALTVGSVKIMVVYDTYDAMPDA